MTPFISHTIKYNFKIVCKFSQRLKNNAGQIMNVLRKNGLKEGVSVWMLQIDSFINYIHILPSLFHPYSNSAFATLMTKILISQCVPFPTVIWKQGNFTLTKYYTLTLNSFLSLFSS